MTNPYHANRLRRRNDGVIQRKHVGSHRRELPALIGRLRRTGNVLMRQEGQKKRKGNVRMKRLNVWQRWRRSFWSWERGSTDKGIDGDLWHCGLVFRYHVSLLKYMLWLACVIRTAKTQQSFSRTVWFMTDPMHMRRGSWYNFAPQLNHLQTHHMRFSSTTCLRWNPFSDLLDSEVASAPYPLLQNLGTSSNRIVM